MIETLEQKKQWGVLIEIALCEREIDRALALLSNLDSGIKSRFLVQVAEAAAKTRPVRAVELYQEIVERAISGRDRKSYRVAASYLLKVKGLYERLDRQSNWQEYCRGLRSKYIKLRALQDEINKAGL